MKCPMKFNNPCSDIDEECDPECAWCLTYKTNGVLSRCDERSCAIALIGASGRAVGGIPAILVDRNNSHE